SLAAPAPGHRDGSIRSPASYPTRAMERPSSGVWSRPAGARKSRRRMLLSGLGRASPPTICLPIRVLAERREIMLHAPRFTLHAPRLQLQEPGANVHWGRGDEKVEDVFRGE